MDGWMDGRTEGTGDIATKQETWDLLVFKYLMITVPRRGITIPLGTEAMYTWLAFLDYNS